MKTNEIGILGEMRVVFEITKQHAVSIPVSSAVPYDLIVDKNRTLIKVQVKTINSNGSVIIVNTTTTKKHVGGRKKNVLYDKNDFDWLVVVDITTDKCYYIPMSVVQHTKGKLYLRLTPPKNNRMAGVVWAKDFEMW